MRKLYSVFLALALILAIGPAVRASAQATEEKPKEEKQEKKKKKEKKEKKEAKEQVGAEESSSEADIRRALTQTLRGFVNGLEGQSPRSALDYLANDRFYDYPRFEEGVEEFLRSTGEMRLFVRQVNVQIQKDKAVMIVDGEMRYSPRSDPSQQQRRATSITFDFQRTAKGWKITEINPRNFFLP